MTSFLANSWPILGAIALVIVITIGATMPYIRKDRKRRQEMEQNND